MRRRCHLLALLLLASPAAALASEGQRQAGWQSVALGDGLSQADLYLPPAGWQGAPGVVFLHGSGSDPRLYRVTLTRAAEAQGIVLLMPRSADPRGWGFAGDSQILGLAVETLLDAGIDPGRLSVAGHSSGGAYAYLQTYLGPPRFAAVLSFGAPFQPVPALLSEEPVPPIRMVYGTDDPHYRSALPPLRQQWQRLGVPWEEDLLEGYGHNQWPQEATDEGLAFLVAHSRADTGGPSGGVTDDCETDDRILCMLDGRFAAQVGWRDHADRVGVGRLVTSSRRSGLFWFFAPDNWELMVKVLDGCDINGHYWVLAAATTDVEFTLRVTDRYLQRTAVYENPLGRVSPAIVDTEALATCP